jgi:hypothetical protein
MSETSTTDLVQQGLTAARVGDVEEARRLLSAATRQMPGNVEAWLGLAGVVDSLEEKRDCFSKALALDPENHQAEAGLARVEKKMAELQAPVQPGSVQQAGDDQESGLAACYRHPEVETGLRCNRCNRPICPRCARRTPVGFRCPDCIREQENKYYSGGSADYFIAALIAFPLSLIAAGLFTYFLGRLGFWVIFIGIFIAPAVAGFIAEAVRWGVRKRRSRYLGHVAAGSLILATVIVAFPVLASLNLFAFLAPGIFLVLGAGTVLARLR